MAGQVTKTATVMTCVRNGYSSTPTGYAVGGPGTSPSYNNSIYMTFPSFGLPAGSVITDAHMDYAMTDWDWAAAVSMKLKCAVGAGTPSNQVGTQGTEDATSVPSSTLTSVYEAFHTAEAMLANGDYYLKMYCANGDNRKNYTSTKATITVDYVAPPDGPTLDSAVRNSDTQATIDWTNNPTTEAPYTTLEVWRKTNGGADTQIASGLSGTTVQYVDNSITAGNFYQYFIKAVNLAGSGLSSLSDALYAVPTAPSSVAGARYSTTQNQVTWVNNPTTGAPYTSLTIECNPDGGGWAEVISGLGPTNTSYLHTPGNNTVGYLYRVKAIGPGGTSAWGTSPTETIVAPAAPTVSGSTGASRVSDTQATIGWTNNPTSDAPYTTLNIQRSTDGGTYTQVASGLAGTTTSWNDTTVSANHRYAYKVQAVNTAGSTLSANASNTVYNTPAAPTNPVATKTGASTATVTWTDASNTEEYFQVQRSVDGGAYADVGSPLAAGTVSYDDPSVPGGTITYKIRAYRGSLTNTSVASNSITTTQPPAAPTVSPSWPAYSPTGSTIRLAWQHNSLDGSGQSGAYITWTKDGVNQTGITITGSQAYYDLSIAGLAANKVVTAKVKTKGLHVDYGPDSTLQSTTVADNPEVSITTPATDQTVVTDLPLVVAWSYNDEFSQANWTLQLYDADNILIRTWTGTTETSQAMSIVDLADDSSYHLHLTARSGAGFEGTTDRSFSTDYAAPTAPTIGAVFDTDALSTDVIGTAGAQGGNPATDHLELYRVDTYRGVTAVTLLANPLPNGSTITDYVPRLGQTVTYRLLALAANGAYSQSEATVDTEARGAYALNYGDGYAELLKLHWDVSAGRERSSDSEVYTFAGRPDPVQYAGEHVGKAITLSAVLLDEDDLPGLEAAGEWTRPFTYRAPNGYRAHVNMSRITDQDQGEPGATPVTVDLVVVE